MRLVIGRLVIGGLGLAMLLGGCVSDDRQPFRPQPRPGAWPRRDKPIPAPGFDPFRGLSRQLRSGMKTTEIFNRLGAPQKVVLIGGGRQKWRYGHPKRLQLELLFVDDRLRSWEMN